MGLIKYQPTTPSRRFMTTLDFSEITTSQPHKSLTEAKRKTGGRNKQGRITSRWISGGHKQRYRIIDFVRRDKEGVPCTVKSIEYDKNKKTGYPKIDFDK